MELRDADVRAARFVDGLDEQLLDVPKALLAKKLEVAAGHEAALAGHRLDEAWSSSSAYARLVVMTLMRRSPASARMEGSCCPSPSSPVRMRAFICETIWS